MGNDSVALIDRSALAKKMNTALRFEAGKTAAVTIDCQRGNLASGPGSRVRTRYRGDEPYARRRPEGRIAHHSRLHGL